MDAVTLSFNSFEKSPCINIHPGEDYRDDILIIEKFSASIKNEVRIICSWSDGIFVLFLYVWRNVGNPLMELRILYITIINTSNYSCYYCCYGVH